MSPMGCHSSSKVRAAAVRWCALSFENAVSMGFRSGEH